jgi:hypothetical protein
MIFQVYFQLVLKDEWQPVFHKAAHLPSMLAMAIAHWEKVAVTQSQEVGARDIGVLVDFVRVVRT